MAWCGKADTYDCHVEPFEVGTELVGRELFVRRIVEVEDLTWRRRRNSSDILYLLTADKKLGVGYNEVTVP